MSLCFPTFGSFADCSLLGLVGSLSLRLVPAPGVIVVLHAKSDNFWCFCRMIANKMPLRRRRRAWQKTGVDLCLNPDIGEVMVIGVTGWNLGYFLRGMEISTDLLSKKNHNSSIRFYLWKWLNPVLSYLTLVYLTLSLECTTRLPVLSGLHTRV